jgi:hypothetical protein
MVCVKMFTANELTLNVTREVGKFILFYNLNLENAPVCGK